MLKDFVGIRINNFWLIQYGSSVVNIADSNYQKNWYDQKSFNMDQALVLSSKSWENGQFEQQVEVELWFLAALFKSPESK